MRRMVDGPVPLFLIDANEPGSGKGLLVDAGYLILTGRQAARTSNTTDDAEMRKRLTAIAMEADPLILLDNVAGRLGTPSLDSVLTTGRWKDRILGGNKQFDGPMTTIWVATGNNVTLQGDTPRRTCYIRLDSEVENPEDRENFRVKNLPKFVRQNRLPLLKYLLTIPLAWIAAGRPPQQLRPWGSYEGWDPVRQCLLWLGLPDPAVTRLELREQSEGDGLVAVYRAWEVALGLTHSYTAAQICRQITEPANQRMQRLKEALCSICELPLDKSLHAQKLGYVLRSNRNKLRGEVRLVSAGIDRHSKAQLWRLRHVHELSHPSEG